MGNKSDSNCSGDLVIKHDPTVGVTSVLVASTGHPDYHSSNNSVAYVAKQIPTRTLHSFQYSEAVDIKTNPGYYRATDSDMASGSSLGPNFIVTVTGSTDHTDQHGPWGQHGS